MAMRPEPRPTTAHCGTDFAAQLTFLLRLRAVTLGSRAYGQPAATGGDSRCKRPLSGFEFRCHARDRRQCIRLTIPLIIYAGGFGATVGQMPRDLPPLFVTQPQTISPHSPCSKPQRRRIKDRFIRQQIYWGVALNARNFADKSD